MIISVVLGGVVQLIYFRVWGICGRGLRGLQLLRITLDWRLGLWVMSAVVVDYAEDGLLCLHAIFII